MDRDVELVNQLRIRELPSSQKLLVRESAIAALRSLVADGNYGPGDRLPPERELIESLQMSRTTLRKALDELEREGAIWRRVGKGTFVSGQASETLPSEFGGLGQQMTPVKVMRARICIEASIAREAAINASGEAIIRIRLAKERAMNASSWSDYEAQDDLFHRAVAEASDNALLLALFDQLNQVRRSVTKVSVVRNSKRPPAGHSSFLEHERITAAISARDADAAQAAMRHHIGSVSARLFGEV